MMRCDGSLHGFRAGAATPRSRESGGRNSGIAGKRRYELQGCGKAELVFWFRSSLYFV
ncbi:hypothetical protein PAXRUDRAFT_835828, partial [Paxillus rubicundulus Ve08.2h10]